MNMKLNKWLYIIPAACAMAFSSCGYDEDPIAPSGDYDVIRFDFPQGDNDFDREIKEIHDKYGFYIIYKDVTLPDLNRKWTSVGTDNTFYGNDVADEDMPFYVNFIKSFLPMWDIDIVKKTFPIKLYCLSNFRAIPYGQADRPYTWCDDDGNPSDVDNWGNPVTENVSPYFTNLKTNGFDYWAISFRPSEISSTVPKRLTCAMMFRLIQQSRAAGVLSDPPTMRDGIDFETRLEPYKNIDQENHPFHRGFIYWIYDEFTSRTGAVEVNTGSDYIAYYQDGNNNYRDYCECYVKAAMWYTRDEFIAKYPPEKYPILLEKFDLVVNWYKDELGMDLQAIAKQS